MTTTIPTAERFSKGTEVPRGVSREESANYHLYVSACRSERISIWSFADWKRAGGLTLAQMRVKWHESYLAQMCERYGADWKPSADNESEGGEGKASKSGSKAPSPSRGATKRVWAIADEMLEAAGSMPERKAVIAACEAQGINKGTAQVQFGKWKKEREG